MVMMIMMEYLEIVSGMYHLYWLEPFLLLF